LLHPRLQCYRLVALLLLPSQQLQLPSQFLLGPLEEKLRKFVFSGEEADEQAFIYHYQTDRHDRLCVGDGSDK